MNKHMVQNRGGGEGACVHTFVRVALSPALDAGCLKDVSRVAGFGE